MHIRDSKLPPETGPRLTVPAPAWSTFLAYATHATEESALFIKRMAEEA
ncbi:DUF397 domain-containing protein [Streptomyces sp. NPDC056486]